jgi:tetratricopeptide (TPR) repeat protein
VKRPTAVASSKAEGEGVDLSAGRSGRVGCSETMCDRCRVRTAGWPICRRRCLLASAYARIGLAGRPTGRGKLRFAKGSTSRPALASRLAVPGVVLVVVVLAGSAQGQSSPAWIRCSGGKGISADGQIGGCTIVIQSGRESPQNLARAFSNRGTAFFAKGDYRRAIQDYSQVINLDPSNATALDNRCWTRATLGLVEEALQDCDQSLKLRPKHASTLATRGFVHLKSGELDAAIVDYNAALTLDPHNPYALYGRGVAKTKKADASGNDDIIAAKAISIEIAQEFARYGLK